MHTRLSITTLLFASVFCTVVHGANTRQINSWMRRAQSYETVGRKTDAVKYYRRAWDADHSRVDAALRGSAILAELRRYRAARDWLKQSLDSAPHHALLWVEYGDVLDRMGDRTESDSAWTRGSRSASDLPAFFMGVSDRLIQREQVERAAKWSQVGLAMVEPGRRPLLERRLFEVALLRSRYSEVAVHAARHVTDNADRAQEILGHLRKLELPSAAWDTLAAATAMISREDTTRTGTALLAAETALESGSWRDSERLFLRAAFSSSSPAGNLLEFSRSVERRGYDHVAAVLREALVLGYPGIDAALRGATSAIGVFVKNGENDRAIRLCRLVLSRPRLQRIPYTAYAAMTLGDLLLKKGDLDGAEEQYRMLLRSKHNRIRQQARLGIGECRMIAGRFESAEVHFSAIAKRAGRSPQGLNARLLQIRLAMYRGDAKLMGAKASALVRTVPASPQANDALAYLSALKDAGRDTVAWKRWSYLNLLVHRGHVDSAISGCGDLGGTSLALRGVFLAADAMIRSGARRRAADTLGVAAAAWPASLAGEEARWRRANLLLSMKDAAGALAEYRVFLREYPESVYAGPARRRVRELRGEMR